MTVVKMLLLVAATISVPLLTFFLVRLALKLGRTVSHLNRTLDDARPQFNLLLTNLNQTVEEVNNELEKVGLITNEAREILERGEGSLEAVEKALRSPLARLGGMAAAFATTSFLFRGMIRRLENRGW